MKEPGKSPKLWSLELVTLRRDAEDEIAAVQRLSHRLVRTTTAAALEEFPALKNLSPTNSAPSATSSTAPPPTSP